MRSQHICVRINLQLLSMDIDLNKEESAETCIFINFSIREYVDEIRTKNPAKCWPFGSLRTIDNKVVSSYHPSDINCPEDTTELTEAPNCMIESLGNDSDMCRIVCNGSSELTFCKVNDGQNRHENHVDEGVKIRHNVAADNNEPGRTRLRRKSHKFRLLSDIYKDPASELRAGCDRTNPENVNRRFVTEIEDELDDDDDVTLAAYFRKQKGVEITDSTLKKKREVVGVEEPCVDQDRKSKHGPEDSIRKDSNGCTSRKKSRTNDMVHMDSQTMPEHKEDVRLHCSQNSKQFAEVSSKEATEKEKENEDSEMEAVMLLARRFKEDKQILRELETNTTCACAKKKIQQSRNKPIRKTLSKTATKHPVNKITKQKLENAFRSFQRRPRIPMKATTGSGFQSHVEVSMMQAAGGGSKARNRATLVCSFNRNPADFSIPNGENKFMRGD